MRFCFGLGFGTVVAPEPPEAVPVNTSLPVVTGTTVSGEALSVSNGTWSNGPITGFAYQWYADDVAISGATSDTYTLTNDEIDASITAGVVASNSVGSGVEAVSASVGPVDGEIATPVIDDSFTLPGDFNPLYDVDWVAAAPDGANIGDTIQGQWGTSEAAAIAMTPEETTLTEGMFIDGDRIFPTLDTFCEAQNLTDTISYRFKVVRGAAESGWSNFGAILLEDGVMDDPGLSDLTDQPTSTRVWSASFNVAGLGTGCHARLTGTGPIRVGGSTVYEAGEEVLVQNGNAVEFGVDTDAGAGQPVENVVTNRGAALTTFTATTAGAGLVTQYRSSGASATLGFVTDHTFSDVTWYANKKHMIAVMAECSSSANQPSAVSLSGTAASKVAEIKTSTNVVQFWEVVKTDAGTGNLAITVNAVNTIGFHLWTTDEDAVFVASEALAFGFPSSPAQTASLTYPDGGSILIAVQSSGAATAMTPISGCTEEAEVSNARRYWAGQRDSTGQCGVTYSGNPGHQILAISMEPAP